MNYLKNTILIFGMAIYASSCNYCSTCRLYQNDEPIFALDDCSSKKSKNDAYKEIFEKQNNLLKYANAKFMCEDE